LRSIRTYFNAITDIACRFAGISERPGHFYFDILCTDAALRRFAINPLLESAVDEETRRMTRRPGKNVKDFVRLPDPWLRIEQLEVVDTCAQQSVSMGSVHRRSKVQGGMSFQFSLA